MKITRYGMEDLARARELQKECVGLHLPSPPVVHWSAKVGDENETLELIEAKANSYVRNALNMLAYHIGYCASTMEQTGAYGDGIVNVKTIPNPTSSIGTVPNRYTSNVTLALGDMVSPEPESLDSYTLDTISTTNWTKISNQVFSYFDTATRKIITSITAQYNNISASSQNITSSSIHSGSDFRIKGSSSTYSYILLIRDVFPAIIVPAGKSIVFTYTTEVLFPNS